MLVTLAISKLLPRKRLPFRPVARVPQLIPLFWTPMLIVPVFVTIPSPNNWANGISPFTTILLPPSVPEATATVGVLEKTLLIEFEMTTKPLLEHTKVNAVLVHKVRP